MNSAPITFTGAAALRLRAEKLVRLRPEEIPPRQAKVGSQRIIQELEIHQIELELQNEELRQAKGAMDASLEKYTDLYDFAPVGYLSLDERGHILEVNLTGAHFLGAERSRLLNRRFLLFLAPQSRPDGRAFLERIFSGFQKESCEALLLKDGGTGIWVGLEGRKAVMGAGLRQSCRMAMIDISARKRAEAVQRRIIAIAATNRRLGEDLIRRQQTEVSLRKSEQRAHRLLDLSHQLQARLRKVSHKVLKAQENERKRISRELHDDISQLLVGLDVHLANFTKAAVINPRGIRRGLMPLRRLVAQSVSIVHGFARELRPAMLDDLGLIPALRHYISSLPVEQRRRTKFTAYTGVETLNNDKLTVFYRIAQEALTNVAKHAPGSAVTVVIRKTVGGACLEVTDNGKGFKVGPVSSAGWNNRLGLIGMRERVEMVGGRFNVVSIPGKGTTVRAEIPFRAKNIRG